MPAQYLIIGNESEKENELGEFLNGRTGANNILLNTERKRLGFIGGKVSYSASTEMLGNRQLPVLIEACSKIVDYVIIDTPPSGMIGDAQILHSMQMPSWSLPDRTLHLQKISTR